MDKKELLISFFYKERYLLKSDLFNKQAISQDTASCFINRVSKENISEDVIHFLQKRIKNDLIKNRLACEDIDLFVAFDKITGQPLGYYWSLTSNQITYWHDAFSIPLNTALVFNAYVSDEARRKGVYSTLINKTHQYLLEGIKCCTVFTIVEKKNTPSLKANLKANLKKHKHNYLVKLFSKNVFSIYKNGRTVTYFILFRKKNTIL